jgi:hypothetical protein
MALSKPTLGVNTDYAARIGALFDKWNDGNYEFPAAQVPSADPNTLDDYEEGTWTIAARFGGASVGQTTSANTGRYTKQGDDVRVRGVLTLTAKGSSTGDATIGTLPFTVRANTPAACPLWLTTVTFADWPMAIFAQGGTSVVLQESTNAGAVTNLTHSDFADTSQVSVGGGFGV